MSARLTSKQLATAPHWSFKPVGRATARGAMPGDSFREAKRYPRSALVT